MRKRTAFLIYSSFILILIFIFPLRGIVSLVDDKDIIKTNSIEGFWWKGSLEDAELENRPIGDIKIHFSPISLIKGKFAFNLDIRGSEFNLKGFMGFTFSGNIFIEDTNLTINPILKTHSGKAVFKNVSNIKAYIKFLYFNNKKCINADGTGTGETLDVFGLFSQQIYINLKLDCQDNFFKIAFESNPNNILEGEVIIKPNLEFDLEARSKRLSKKIIEASKLNFKKDPSFKISGRLDELMNIN